jgi:hypothetical protein
LGKVTPPFRLEAEMELWLEAAMTLWLEAGVGWNYSVGCN